MYHVWQMPCLITSTLNLLPVRVYDAFGDMMMTL